ncbi:NAD(P)H-quinone oxidoreductase [Rhodococcus sp. 14-2470-1a]|uniref:NAD(P)H-quinone oxidoreductase n=1 Tax=Rhodococcus sp. 14-2470-1a TaxID=2023150 RepID=UPI000B9A930A|nr:NAD(P)H-quinone oxidoreductase [Rhodococcus sp. 14-2470-1a]OZF42015.1 NAD(P)H-quinone oxidoreductase [Rhodococcus sp. 14-2470-1a]
MYAVTMHCHGGPDVLQWAKYRDPRPAPGEVVIDVAAAAVNRADVMQRQGNYPPPPGASEILGLECSGTIAEVGVGVSRWSVGDEVCALLSGGGYAEKVAVPAAQVLEVPAGVSVVDAAALPEVACTVWSNLVMSAGLGPGQLLLIHGGASGIGTHAIQVATALGARVAVTAGSAYKLDKCRELGAEFTINYRTDDFVEVMIGTGPRGGADIILDNMGGEYLKRNVDALAFDGQLVVIGMQGGRAGELDIGSLLAKRGSVAAASLRGRPLTGPSSKADVVSAVTAGLWPLITAGRVVPVVHTRLPITAAGDAHELLDSSDTVGKVILTVD